MTPAARLVNESGLPPHDDRPIAVACTERVEARGDAYRITAITPAPVPPKGPYSQIVGAFSSFCGVLRRGTTVRFHPDPDR
jgi:hypothetical protein